PAAPKAGVVAGLDLTGYTTTPAIQTPTVEGRIQREAVLIEWTDRHPSNDTFEGTARELLRVQEPTAIHPLGEMTFNPNARPGDAGSGEQRDSRRMNPQRLDTIVGKILRIIPDLREQTKTSTVSENGRYRIPARRRLCSPSTSGSPRGKPSTSFTRARITDIRCAKARKACRPRTAWVP